MLDKNCVERLMVVQQVAAWKLIWLRNCHYVMLPMSSVAWQQAWQQSTCNTNYCFIPHYTAQMLSTAQSIVTATTEQRVCSSNQQWNKGFWCVNFPDDSLNKRHNKHCQYTGNEEISKWIRWIGHWCTGRTWSQRRWILCISVLMQVPPADSSYYIPSNR